MAYPAPSPNPVALLALGIAAITAIFALLAAGFIMVVFWKTALILAALAVFTYLASVFIRGAAGVHG